MFPFLTQPADLNAMCKPESSSAVLYTGTFEPSPPVMHNCIARCACDTFHTSHRIGVELVAFIGMTC